MVWHLAIILIVKLLIVTMIDYRYILWYAVVTFVFSMVALFFDMRAYRLHTSNVNQM